MLWMPCASLACPAVADALLRCAALLLYPPAGGCGSCGRMCRTPTSSSRWCEADAADAVDAAATLAVAHACAVLAHGLPAAASCGMAAWLPSPPSSIHSIPPPCSPSSPHPRWATSAILRTRRARCPRPTRAPTRVRTAGAGRLRCRLWRGQQLHGSKGWLRALCFSVPPAGEQRLPHCETSPPQLPLIIRALHLHLCTPLSPRRRAAAAVL